MLIKTVTVGPLESNCYLAGDDLTKEIFIIDPGADYEIIKGIIDKDGLKPKAVINTHGHGDHIGANKEFGIPVWIHRLDADFLVDPSKNLSGAFGFLLKTKTASRLLEDGDTLSVGKYKLEVIHTPGHTPGSICLKGEGVIHSTAPNLALEREVKSAAQYHPEPFDKLRVVSEVEPQTPAFRQGCVERVIFTGDTLFCQGIGRTDFAYGSEKDIMRSIKKRIFTLDDDYIIYPGHGPSSTIGDEKINNPFVF